MIKALRSILFIRVMVACVWVKKISPLVRYTLYSSLNMCIFANDLHIKQNVHLELRPQWVSNFVKTPR